MGNDIKDELAYTGTDPQSKSPIPRNEIKAQGPNGEIEFHDYTNVGVGGDGFKVVPAPGIQPNPVVQGLLGVIERGMPASDLVATMGGIEPTPYVMANESPVENYAFKDMSQRSRSATRSIMPMILSIAAMGSMGSQPDHLGKRRVRPPSYTPNNQTLKTALYRVQSAKEKRRIKAVKRGANIETAYVLNGLESGIGTPEELCLTYPEVGTFEYANAIHDSESLVIDSTVPFYILIVYTNLDFGVSDLKLQTYLGYISEYERQDLMDNTYFITDTNESLDALMTTYSNHVASELSTDEDTIPR